MPEILDQFGKPVRRETVVQSKAKDLIQALGRDPDSVNGTVATGITAQRLASVLRANDDGNNEDFVTLAKEMPERDLHYFSQLQIRRNAVRGAQIKILPNKRGGAQATKIAEEFDEYVAGEPNFRWLIGHLMDAVNIGYSVVQPVWDTSTTPWTFKEYVHQDPRAFEWEGRDIRIRDKNRPKGRPLPPGMFVVHLPEIVTGLPLRGGMARLAAATWFLKTSGIKSWVSFVEVFGMPLRLGKYNPESATEDDKYELLRTLISLGHDAAGIIPVGMDIEFVDARRPTSGDNLYEGLCRYFDEQVSKAVNGQTMSSDNGSSQSQAVVHEHVRLDIAEADALAVSSTLRVIARMWTQFQYGLNAPVPIVELDVRPPEGDKEKAETLKAVGDALSAIKTAGYEMPLEDIQETFSIRLEKAPEPEPVDPNADPNADPNPDPRRQAAPNASIPDSTLPDITDEITTGALDEWQGVMQSHISAVNDAADRASSYDAFLAELDGLADQIDSNPLVRHLAVASMKARGAGEA